METIKVCTYGIYTTIGATLKISPSLACKSFTTPTYPRHEIVKLLHDDLIKAQEEVISKYQQKGLI
jgi:hypothetical protein